MARGAAGWAFPVQEAAGIAGTSRQCGSVEAMGRHGERGAAWTGGGGDLPFSSSSGFAPPARGQRVGHTTATLFPPKLQPRA